MVDFKLAVWHAVADPPELPTRFGQWGDIDRFRSKYAYTGKGLQLSENAANKMHYGHFTYYSKTVLQREAVGMIPKTTWY